MRGLTNSHWVRRFGARGALLLAMFLPACVLAQTFTHSALIDSDNDALTGCTVTTAAGSVSGVELRLTASVSAIPPQVDSVTREVCSGGVFGAPLATGGGYPVALNVGTGGADAIEMAFVVSDLPGAGTDDWQVAFQSESALGADQMGPETAVGIGIAPPVLQIPALSPAGLVILSILMGLLLLWGARRHRGVLSVLMFCGSLSLFGLAWAASFIADGDLNDWVGVSPLVTDPVGDSTSGQENIDLVAGFIARESGQIFLRVDVADAEVQNLAPVVADQTFNLDENSANATSVGSVVASDADVGDVLTYAITSGNGSGTFALDANSGAITVADNTALDFETTPSFVLVVSVTDDGIPNLASSATVTINLNDLNEAPSIADQSFNVLEDASNATVVGTSAGADPDGTAPNNSLSYAITAGNSGGAFAIDGNGQITVATSAAITVVNSPFNLTVSVTDGGAPNLNATAAVTISVTHVNHEPTFTPGLDPTVLEDAGAQTLSGWATAIDDGDGGTDTLSFNVTANTNAALFSTQPAVDPTSGNLTFTSAANANGSATITLELMDDGGTANGGDDTSPAVTVSISVTAVNDTPSFTAGADESVLEDSGAHSVVPWATGLSVGPADEAAQTLSFNVTNNTNPGLFSVLPAIAADGTLSYTVMAATSGSADITIALMDDGGTANGGVDTSATQTFTIEVVAINHEPSFTPGADQTVLEDAVAQTIAGWATAIDDGDGATQVLTFNLSGNTNPGLFSVGPAVAANGTLSYTPAADANGSATITLELMDDGGTANGGDDTSPSVTFDISVTAVNDAPSFSAGAAQTVFEDSGAQSVPGWVTGTSPGPADEAGQTVSFTVSNDNNALFSVQPTVAGNGTLTYTPAANAFGTATISVSAMDDGGTANGGVDTSAVQMVAINVTAINDAPSFTSGGDTNSNEDAGAQTVAGWASAISDGDGNTQVLSFNITGNTNAALFSTAPAVNATNGNLTYTAAPNLSGSASITLTLSDDGGTANGGVDTSAALNFTITINPVNDPPTVANAPSYTVHTNIGIAQADDASVDLLGTARGIADVDSAGPFTIGTTGNGMATTAGGVIDIAANGGFSYDPPLNNIGADTFIYTICDNGTPLPAACVPVTLTLNISGPAIVFVDDSAAASGATGTLRHPLTTLPVGLSALSSGGGTTNLFVFSGTYALPAVQNLANNVRVIGQGSLAASFDALYGITPPALSDARPALSQPSPTLSSASSSCLGLAQNNTLRGLTVGNCSGIALTGSGFGTLTVNDNVAINNATGAALSLTNGTAAATFASVSASGGNPDVSLTTLTGSLNLGSGSLSGASGGLRISAGSANIDYTGSMSITGGRAVDIQNATGGTINLGGTIIHNSGAPQGILLNANTGATVNFSNTLTLSTGVNPAFTATAGGTVTATGGSSSSLATTTGTAVNIANTTIGAAGVSFRSVSASGATSGIILNATGNSGGLSILGDGSNTLGGNNSGGVIQNTSGAGVIANDTRDLRISNLRIANPGADGLNIDQLRGTNSLLNSATLTSIDNNSSSAVRINNNARSFNMLVDNSRFSNSTTTQVVFLTELTGNYNSQLDIEDSEFVGLVGDALSMVPSLAGAPTDTGTLVHNFLRNTVRDSNAAGVSSLNAGCGGAVNCTYNFQDNQIRNLAKAGNFNAGLLNLGYSGLATSGGSFTATVSGNRIEATDAASIDHRRGINIISEPTVGSTVPSMAVTVQNNNINDLGNREALFVSMREPTTVANIKVIGNSIGTGAFGTTAGNVGGTRDCAYIETDAPSTTMNLLLENNTIQCDASLTDSTLDLDAGTGRINLTMRGNVISSSGTSTAFLDAAPFGAAGTLCLDLNASNTGANANTSNPDIVLNQGTGVFQIEGMGAGPNAAAAVEAFLDPRNNNDVSVNAGSYIGVANCPEPP